MSTEEKKPTLLVVEDDYDSQKFLQLFLRREFNVEVCDSSETFYAVLEDQKIDIILMDISLRGTKNGLELTSELKADDQYKHIPVIVLTAHAFHKDKENAYQAGVDAFLTKPVQNDILLNTLLKILKNNEDE
ncbi:MAG: response regulator [Bacteroidota bacterium]